MKNIIILTIILSCFSCDQKQEEQITENIEETILNLERQALNNWSKGDPQDYSVNFSKDVTYMDDIGAQSRLEGLEDVNNYLNSLEGKIPPHSYELVDPYVQFIGETAILTLRYQGISKEGDSLPLWKATIVYALNNDTWNVEHANWSLVKEN